MVGFINPHCRRCGKTAIELARTPASRCLVMTLPFEETTRPAQAGLQLVGKERAS